MTKIKYMILTLVLLLTAASGAWAAQVELKLGAKIKNGDVLTFGDTRVHFATPCSLPYVIFSAVNTSTTASISYNDNEYSITFSPLVDATDIEYPDDTQLGVGAALGLKTGQTQPEYVMVTEGTGTFADPFILTPYAPYNCGGSPVDGKAICDASDPSAIKVDWNKTAKTGTFTMPGGNVTLEPEYYPQAALTAVPTAINDVPATTDGAIVSAGTVANIGSTTTAQGTVMYYVSPTALDDDALLALAADQWTADVPTAESLAEGTAYVYYYVRGNDSDTDEENFSDGDILAANALTVTIAAAPTYAVTFADGTVDADKWTADPNADVKKGQTVTVTYTGTRKVIGVKAEKKSASTPLDNTMTAWTAGTFAVPAGGLTYSDAITVSGDVTLVLTDGETLTLNKGISLASGATLTVQGNGTMNVNGTSGSTASTVAGSGTLVLTSGTLTAKGGNGGSVGGDHQFDVTANAGGVAINGAVTVNGGTLTATGGNGGSVTGDHQFNCKGGAGGAAISGDLTVNSGTMTTTNGTNGSVANMNIDCTAGAGGKAVAGTVTDNR